MFLWGIQIYGHGNVRYTNVATLKNSLNVRGDHISTPQIDISDSEDSDFKAIFVAGMETGFQTLQIQIKVIFFSWKTHGLL